MYLSLKERDDIYKYITYICEIADLNEEYCSDISDFIEKIINKRERDYRFERKPE